MPDAEGWLKIPERPAKSTDTQGGAGLNWADRAMPNCHWQHNSTAHGDMYTFRLHPRVMWTEKIVSLGMMIRSGICIKVFEVLTQGRPDGGCCEAIAPAHSLASAPE